MHRRVVLSALAATLASAAIPSRAEVRTPIRWSDIRLVDGRTLKASELQDRTVVVEYWASWCPFCMKQNPFIEKLHRQAGGDSLRVLTFTIDKTEQAARDYIARHGYTFAAAMAGPQSEAWFGRRRGLPEVHVVDPAGRIVFSEIGEMFEEDIAALARFAARAP
jgi:thiol-disulfide isomerase/thioredoxin